MTQNKNILGKMALLGASLLWGGSFLVLKNSLDVFGPHSVLTIRFTIGFLLLSICFLPRWKMVQKEYIKTGAVLGILLFLAYSLQTVGITDTTPGKNAFLTVVYVVIVPFLYWITDRKKPKTYQFMAAMLALVGIGFVSLSEGLSIGYGDSLTLISGFFYGAHMIALAKLVKDKDPVLVTIIQFGFVAVFSAIVTLFTEQMPSSLEGPIIYELLYLSVFATAVCLLLQTVGQKHTDPTSASLLLSLESVFGVILSVMFSSEEVSLRVFIGFVIIFLAVIWSETKFSFLKKKENNKFIKDILE